MKKIVVIIFLVMAVTAVATAQARYNRMNLEIEENYHFFHNPDFGNGNMVTVDAEWLPSFNKPEGVWGVINSDFDRFAIGGYYSTTLKSWEDKKISLDTARSISDLSSTKFGIIGLVNITEFQTIGDLTAVIKTGPSFYSDTAWNAVNYKSYHEVYIDSVLDHTEYLGEELKRFSESNQNLNWDFSAKITRFNRESIWAFRNSLEINYSTVLKSVVNNYTDSVLIENSENRTGFFSIIGESNIGDFNLSDHCGFDPRIKLGYAKGGKFGFGNTNQFIVGVSVSLVPRLDRKSDVLNDALSLSYEWHTGPNSGINSRCGSNIILKVNLLSIGRLF